MSPMNSATNRFRGRSYTSAGVSVCSNFPRLMTTIRSEIDIASSWSCVTKRTVIRSSIWMRFSSSRICTRIFASSAENGSSIRRISGLRIRARAVATRCCWPPESWPGYFFSLPSSPKRARNRVTSSSMVWRGILRSFSPKAEVLEHGHVRPEVVVLEHHGGRALFGRQAGDVLPAQDHLPPVRGEEAADGAENRGLAAARGSQEGDELGLGHLQVDVADPLAVAVQLGQSHQSQLRIVRHRALLAYFILKPAARASAPANRRKTVRRTMVGSTRMTANTAPAVDG